MALTALFRSTPKKLEVSFMYNSEAKRRGHLLKCYNKSNSKCPIQKWAIFYRIKSSCNPLRSSGIESPRSGAKKSRNWVVEVRDD